ncbi:PREDICTED: putative mediator of RNA polymerase II transcription subunit 26 [Bactrocera latifrons]|uniref:putative mediator of RNA polymerase II transcription subunit 26 n=1 Tax=Bactrocera latifrons TaxID=174628 RepID=UPI0008DD00A4|nr:PREDICTED: putative mediator of RNA polymerase II transcription subunit 26 [Bactrocera latifrons]
MAKAQQSPHQQTIRQQQSKRHQPQLPQHHPTTPQQQMHQPYQQKYNHQLIGDPFATMLTVTQEAPASYNSILQQQQISQLESQPLPTSTPTQILTQTQTAIQSQSQPQSQTQPQQQPLLQQHQQQQRQQSTQREAQLPIRQPSMSPAHISSPMASSPTVTAQQQQLQHQPLQIQQRKLHQPPQQSPTPTSTPSHHLASILNEAATSNGSSTLAMGSNNSNNSSRNSSTNRIVYNQPTSVHDGNMQSSDHDHDASPAYHTPNIKCELEASFVVPESENDAGEGYSDAPGMNKILERLDKLLDQKFAKHVEPLRMEIRELKTSVTVMEEEITELKKARETDKDVYENKSKTE